MSNDPMRVDKRWPDWPAAFEGQLNAVENAHKDMLDGLAVILQRPEITDLRNASLRYPEARLGVALNKKQTACKMWLAEELARVAGPELGNIHILAGWYGVLALILQLHIGAKARHISVIDRDPHCQPVAEVLNATAMAEGRFSYCTADIMDLYGEAGQGAALTSPDVIINTSCEHLPDFSDWYGSLPTGTLLVLQSNDYEVIPEHVNCVPDLAAFQAMAPLTETLYAGALKLPKYTRFMLIGRR